MPGLMGEGRGRVGEGVCRVLNGIAQYDNRPGGNKHAKSPMTNAIFSTAK